MCADSPVDRGVVQPAEPAPLRLPVGSERCLGDRVPGVVEWNLFDIDAKFGDVEPLERVLEYLDGIAPFESRADSARAPGFVP